MKALTDTHTDIRRGQFIAAGLIAFVAILTTVCAFLGEWRVGCALAGFGAVGTAYAIVGERPSQRKTK